MKRLLSLLILTAMLLSLAACGAVNRTEVSVLWSNLEDEYLIEVADALDRAMYIKNVKHADYDAKGSAALQLSQAEEAIRTGASALVLNATDAVSAAAILAMAKEADIPLVFLCGDSTIVDAALLATYEKCVAVNVDPTTLYTTLGEKIAADLLADAFFGDHERNSSVDDRASRTDITHLR